MSSSSYNVSYHNMMYRRITLSLAQRKVRGMRCYNSQVKPILVKYDWVFTTVLLSGGVLGAGQGIIEGYKVSHNESYVDCVVGTTIGAVMGFCVGVAKIAILPVAIPIGIGIAAARGYERFAMTKS